MVLAGLSDFPGVAASRTREYDAVVCGRCGVRPEPSEEDLRLANGQAAVWYVAVDNPTFSERHRSHAQPNDATGAGVCGRSGSGTGAASQQELPGEGSRSTCLLTTSHTSEPSCHSSSKVGFADLSTISGSA